MYECRYPSQKTSAIWKGYIKTTGLFVAINYVDLHGEDNIEKIFQKMNKAKEITQQCKYLVVIYDVNLLEYTLEIVMEYSEKGSVETLLTKDNPPTEETIAKICKDAIYGLIYLHNCNLQHNSLQASHILMFESGYKLTDWPLTGILQKINRKKRSTAILGVDYWMSPETVANNGEDSPLSDIWSFGITCLEIANLTVPMNNCSFYRFIFRVGKIIPEFESPEKWTKEFQDFVHIMLKRDQRMRPTAKALLEHPFIARVENPTPTLQQICISYVVQNVHKFTKEQIKNLPSSVTEPYFYVE